MHSKNKHTELRQRNLLNDLEFALSLRFEATYGAHIRGGHIPSYISLRTQKRIVSPVNLFTAGELCELTVKFPNHSN